jgi:hypothetical protein
MHPFRCLVINDTGGYICLQGLLGAFRMGWDNTDPGMFGSFGLTICIGSRCRRFTLG